MIGDHAQHKRRLVGAAAQTVASSRRLCRNRRATGSELKCHNCHKIRNTVRNSITANAPRPLFLTKPRQSFAYLLPDCVDQWKWVPARHVALIYVDREMAMAEAAPLAID